MCSASCETVKRATTSLRAIGRWHVSRTAIASGATADTAKVRRQRSRPPKASLLTANWWLLKRRTAPFQNLPVITCTWGVWHSTQGYPQTKCQYTANLADCNKSHTGILRSAAWWELRAALMWTTGSFECRGDGSAGGRWAAGGGFLHERSHDRLGTDGEWSLLTRSQKTPDFRTAVKEGFRSREPRTDCEGFRSPWGGTAKSGFGFRPKGFVDDGRRTAVGVFGGGGGGGAQPIMVSGVLC